MNKFLRVCLSCLLLAAVSTSPALAAAKKKKEPAHHDTVISTISADSITISLDKVMKTFAINQFTEITLKGQKAKITDLQPGMSVSVTQGTDATKAARIAAGDPPKH